MTDSTPSTVSQLPGYAEIRAELIAEMGKVFTDQFHLGAIGSVGVLRDVLRQLRNEMIGTPFEQGLHLAATTADDAHALLEKERRDTSA